MELKSSSRVVKCGVPQGSVLGPKLYNIYTLPISDIVKKHKVQCMLYADDGHLYVCFKPADANVTRIQMETLAADLNDWFIANNLMSNNDKLVALFIKGPCHKPINFPFLTVGDVQIPLNQIKIKSNIFYFKSIWTPLYNETIKTLALKII